MTRELVGMVVTLLSGQLLWGNDAEWKKHVVMEGERVVTALAADFTGDGQVDIITSHSNAVVLYRAPDWQREELYELGKGLCIHSECMDVDGDGDVDYMGSTPKGPPFWLENTGAGLWEARVIDEDVTGVHCLLKADVNGDGAMDVIINNFKTKGELGNSIGWWQVPTRPREQEGWVRSVFADGDAAGGSHYMGFGDLDGDGLGEIAVGAKGAPFEFGNWYAYWKNPGGKQTGAWEKVLIEERVIGATNILIGDVNGDGQNDLVASNGHGVGVCWYEGRTLKKSVIDGEMSCPHALVLADLDDDGDLDVATCGYESKRLSVYSNDGRAQFSRYDVDLDQESYDLRAVDMDGDGDLDLLNAGRQSNNLVWYENPHL